MKMPRYAVLALFTVAFAAPVAAAPAKNVDAVMYKNPDCECCLGHAAALRRAGFAVRVVPTDDMAAFKTKAGVPVALHSCHTLMIAGYAVEGHVPVAIVKRLVAERPAVRGIALPGMPMGSPGMEGPKTAPFRVMSFEAGNAKLYAVE